MSVKFRTQHYVLCVSNERYPASLEPRKIYRHILDRQAEAHRLIRVIDESGEDYLYPADLFISIRIPEKAARVFAHRRGSHPIKSAKREFFVET